MSATRPVPAATGRSPLPTGATLWVDRWPRSAERAQARPRLPQRAFRSSRRGCSTPSSAATGACSTRRPGATRREACSPKSRPKSALLSARARAVPPILIERDGFLIQSPITWFAHKGRWDISPGYGELSPRPNFERIIEPECLFCHANQLHHVAGTLNRYEEPIFEGHAIGCERCHGPGELHVNRRGQSTEPDLTIVNPANLAPALRDSVCQQCHLQGWFRFTRAGREPFDFRPGLPLHRFLAVFVRTIDKRGKLGSVGQVEQMESSRCFRASQGQLGCIWCHDPHRLPEPSTKDAYYRERCLECHEKKGCALSLLSGKRGGRARTALRATCRARPSRPSLTRRRPITGSPAAFPAPCPRAKVTRPVCRGSYDRGIITGSR